MSKLEPLAPELAALLAREAIPQPGPDAATQVLRRVETSAAMLDFVDAGVAAKPTAAWYARAGLGPVLTFVAGTAVGAATVLALQSEAKPRIVYVERPAAGAVAPVTNDSPPPRPPSVTPGSPARPTPSVSASGVRRGDVDTLGAERALIENAREQLARGEAEGALAKLDEHARRFATARLTEEREALAIQALVNADRHEEAKARAAAFRAKWPTSVYLPAVDLTIESIP